MAEAVSMQKIADMVGVSRATVSNALSGRGRVSTEMAERIRSIAEGLNYVPSAAGRHLRMGRSTLLGLVVPDFSMPLFSAFVRAFENAARTRGMALLVGEGMNDPTLQAEVLRDFVSRGVDGLIVVPMRGSVIQPNALPVPVAVVDAASNPLNTASSDHREGGRIVARHLVELGHRKALIVVADRSSFVSDERGAGMAEVFAAAGVEHSVTAIGPNVEAAHAFARNWQPDGTTAIAAAYDAMGVGIVTGLAERGIDVPRQISVTGYDDVIWGRIVRPQLTTVRQDLTAIAEHALDVVTARKQGQHLSPVSLVVRGSTAAPSQQETAR